MERIDYRVKWSGENVTTTLREYLLSMVYTDYLHATSDSIELSFHDRDRQWSADWYPQKGDPLEVEMGTIRAGTFYIDDMYLFSLAGDAVLC